MNMLSESARKGAIAYLESNARPLERALYRFHFMGGTAARVLDELAAFQNPDGGFGHGLECDMRLDGSSVIATTVAFQRIREVRAPADHPVVASGCRYLAATYDASRVSWPVIPRDIDRAPHAPWWTLGGSIDMSMANPRAEIAGIVIEHQRHFPEPMRKNVLGAVVDHLLGHPDEMEMHDLLCYIRLVQTEGLPVETRARMLARLETVVQTVVQRDPAQWKSYGLQPLWVVDTPRSAFARFFASEIEANLDFLLESQDEDGTWKPNWSWGDISAEAWETARREWTGVLTLDALRKLRSFGRISRRLP